MIPKMGSEMAVTPGRARSLCSDVSSTTESGAHMTTTVGLLSLDPPARTRANVRQAGLGVLTTSPQVLLAFEAIEFSG
jgi:hypothetical protein